MKAHDPDARYPVSPASGSGHRPHLLPNFDDDNRTVVIGSPGGTVVLDCRISMLQDYTVRHHLKALVTLDIFAHNIATLRQKDIAIKRQF